MVGGGWVREEGGSSSGTSSFCIENTYRHPSLASQTTSAKVVGWACKTIDTHTHLSDASLPDPLAFSK